MKFYSHSFPRIAKLFLPSAIWKINTVEKKIYLTFDDGPTPGVTDKVLQLLEKKNAKATFFCIGKNVIETPSLYSEIIAEGHSVGNHTYSHLNAWKCTTDEYLKDIKKASDIIETKLFRPPYGRISNSQIHKIKNNFNYDTILWSILSGDFDKKLNRNNALSLIKNKAQKGNILVFHDSIKAASNLHFILPFVLDFFQEQEFDFSKL